MSVWLKQVDTALKSYIASIAKAYDSGGVLKSVPVVIRDPEKEFVIETYPCVSITCYDQRPSKSRVQRGKYISDVDNVEGNVTIRELPQNWDLFYQVDFWAEYQEDIDEMTRRWVGNTGDNFTLTVEDTEATNQTCPVSHIGFANLDDAEGTNRSFRKCYSYKVWAQLDEIPPYSQPFPELVINKVEMP